MKKEGFTILQGMALLLLKHLDLPANYALNLIIWITNPKNKIGYYISSDSLYDLISNCIDEESRLGAIYSNTTSDSELVDKFLENFLIKAISKYHESPELYKSIPFATNLGDLKNEWCRSNGMDG